MTRLPRLLVPLLLALGLACHKEKTCTSDLRLCNDRCTSLATDPANCGACGHSCAAGESCNGGACSCDATACSGASWEGKRSAGTVCDNACVDLASDPANCGACGNACAAGLVCTTSDGGSTSCASACAGTGQAVCGHACVNLQTHRWNCGACGRSCGSKECCVAGRCIADLYLACFNTDEVREATGELDAAGIPLPTALGPGGLAWTGDLLAVVSAESGGVETLAMVHFDPPGVRRVDVLQIPSKVTPDIEYLAEHEGILYLSHNSLGTLLIVGADGTVVDEVALPTVPVDYPSAAPQNPNPQGIAFDDLGHAYVALQALNEVDVFDVSQVLPCALGAHPRPCTTAGPRIDLQPLASPTTDKNHPVGAMPSRIAVACSHAFVALWNLFDDGSFGVPPGSTGRLAAIRTDDATLDAAFAGTTNGLIDLGPGCLNPAGVAALGSTLYVTCGAFAYPAILGAGIVPVDISGPVAQPLPVIAPFPDPAVPYAPGKLAFCGSKGYVGDRNSGRVLVFDPASGSTTLAAGVALCPVGSGGYSYVADIACGR